MSTRPALLVALGLVLAGLPPAAAPAAQSAAVAAPVLKWQYGGCATPPHYCETGWYASPAIADLDHDGKAEVIWGGYDLLALNGEDGTTQWRADSGQRIWPAIAVASLTNPRSTQVIVGRGGDQVTAYSAAGTVLWTHSPFGTGEIRTLAVEDLEQDGRMEVIVGRASGGETKQVTVLEADGSLRAGWPARRDGEPGYGWGMYNENIAIADMNGDDRKEIFAPTDTHYITALSPNGDQLPASPLYGPGKVWSQVGVHVDQAADLRGYAECGTEHRPNFANVAPAIADLDDDGTRELIVPGDVYNCDIGDPDGDMYYLPWVLRADRTRWAASGFDWTTLPAPEPGSGALTQDYTVIESAVINTVIADLDGDGRQEILYPSYDGRLHAWWLDKTQHGAWPFDVPGPGIRFASEPVVADLNADGRAEVIFTSWTEKGSGQVGQIHILDADGNQLAAVPLPAPGANATWNGGLGAPSIANLDADPDLEVVVGTSHSGVVAYDLPGSAGARVLWSTGRGSNRRTGVTDARPALALSSRAAAQAVQPGGAAVYTLSVTGPGGPVQLSVGAPVGPAPLPAVSLSAASVTPPGQATVTLTDQRPAGALRPGAIYAVTVTATSGGLSRAFTLRLLVGGERLYLPLLRPLTRDRPLGTPAPSAEGAGV